ncbi:hypothetical protein Tco_0807716 [Tanacetum coccineum]
MSVSWANNIIPRVTVEAIVALLAPEGIELTEKTDLKLAEVVDIVVGPVSGSQRPSECRMAGFLCWISWFFSSTQLFRRNGESFKGTDFCNNKDGGFHAAAIKETHRLRRTSSSSNSRKRNKVHKNLVVLENLGSKLLQEQELLSS